MTDYYDRFGNPIPADWWDKAKYGNKINKDQTDQRIGKTVVGEVTVSTVWLAINHQYIPGIPPLIFETMVFGGGWDQEMDRYSTEEQAMRGHLAAVDRLRVGQSPFAHCEVTA